MNMAPYFSCMVALTFVLLAATRTESIQFLARYFNCSDSNEGLDLNKFFLASACQPAGGRTSMGGSCSNEYKHFNSTDCSGEVLLNYSNICTLVAPASRLRYACQDINDPEYIRSRDYYGAGCANTSPTTYFIRLNKCYEGTTATARSYKYEKLNSTAYTMIQYTAVDCNPGDVIQMNTTSADGSCDSSGVRTEFILAGDVDNSAALARISTHVLSVALAFAGIVVVM